MHSRAFHTDLAQLYNYIHGHACIVLGSTIKLIVLYIHAISFQIPKEIGLLQSLSCLDLSHNKDLRHLPYEMGNLEFLFMVSIHYAYI